MLRKILIASLGLVTAHAFADIPDYYTGFQIGYGSTQKASANTAINDKTIALTQNKNTGVAGRVFVGYAVTPFYAMEIGLAHYTSASWHTSINNQATPNTSVSLDGADISTRFSWISRPAFAVYNSLGLTYIRAHYGSYNDGFQLNKARYFLRPKVSIGGNYNLSDTTQLNASYTHVFGKGHLVSAVNTQKSSDYMPPIGAIEFGLIYNF